MPNSVAVIAGLIVIMSVNSLSRATPEEAIANLNRKKAAATQPTDSPDRLKQQIATLEKQIAILEGKLKAAGIPFDPMPAMANNANPPPVLPVKRILSLPEMLLAMPADAKPDTKAGWDEFSLPKAHKWMNDNLPGHQIAGTPKISEIRLTRVYEGAQDNTIGWDITMRFASDAFQAFGGNQFYFLCPNHDPQAGMWGNEITIRVDEGTAKSARAWKTGDAIQITGTISSVDLRADFDYRSHTRYGVFSVFMDDCDILIPPIPGVVHNVSVGKKTNPQADAYSEPRRTIHVGKIR